MVSSRYAVVTTKGTHPACHADYLRALLSCETGFLYPESKSRPSARSSSETCGPSWAANCANTSASRAARCTMCAGACAPSAVASAHSRDPSMQSHCSIEPRPAVRCRQAKPFAGSRPFVVRELPFFRREEPQCRLPCRPRPRGTARVGSCLPQSDRTNAPPRLDAPRKDMRLGTWAPFRNQRRYHREKRLDRRSKQSV